MRTSLNEIKEAEDFLLSTMGPQDSLVYKAKLILDPVLHMQTMCQKKLYSIITLYGRRSLKKEIVSLHTAIFSDPKKKDLHNRMQELFTKP